MPKELRMLGLALVAGLAWSGAATASGLDDDLAIVKRAVARGCEPSAAPRSEVPPPAAVAARPAWLKLRLVENGAARPGFSLELRLPRGGHTDATRADGLIEALRSRELLRIQADQATLRVWVE